MATKIPFGERDGRMVTADSVERGKACGCVCPACGGALIANKGDLKIHHFSHQRTSDNCPHPAETALHRMAKQILANTRYFDVPEWMVTSRADLADSEGRAEISCSGVAHACQAGRFVVDEAHLEQATEDGRLRPDVRLIGHPEGREDIEPFEIWVEVAVTHPVDEQKLARLRQAGTRCLELDLSEWDPMNAIEELTDVLLGANGRKAWKSHPNEPRARETAYRKAYAEACRVRQEKKRREAREKRKREIELKRQQERKRRRAERREQIRAIAVRAIVEAKRIVLPAVGVGGLVTRPEGRWVIEKATEITPEWDSDTRFPADVRIEGPEGVLWIQLLSRAESRYRARKKEVPPEGPVVTIDLIWLEKNGKKIDPKMLSYTLRHRAKLKQWRRIPLDATPSTAIPANSKVEQTAAVPDAKPPKSGRPRSRRAALLAHGAVRPQTGRINYDDYAISPIHEPAYLIVPLPRTLLG